MFLITTLILISMKQLGLILVFVTIIGAIFACTSGAKAQSRPWEPTTIEQVKAQVEASEFTTDFEYPPLPADVVQSVDEIAHKVKSAVLLSPGAVAYLKQEMSWLFIGERLMNANNLPSEALKLAQAFRSGELYGNTKTGSVHEDPGNIARS
jgi:hypothetical protein